METIAEQLVLAHISEIIAAAEDSRMTGSGTHRVYIFADGSKLTVNRFNDEAWITEE